MKKGLLVGALLLSAGMASAQNLYVGVHAGYGFATPSDNLGTTTVISSTGDQTSTAIYGSYGGGTNFGLNVGFMFSENFGADLGLTYFMGSSVVSTDVTAPTGTATLTAKSSQMRIAPSLLVTTGGNLAAYARIGLVIPAGGSTTAEYRDNTNPLAVQSQDLESKGSFSLGYQGALGVSYGLSDKLSLFGELAGVNLRIKSGSRTLTAATVNGTDIMGSLTTYDKETTYVDELNASSNNSSYNADYSDAKAKESLASTTNFNGLFINIGVKFSF